MTLVSPLGFILLIENLEEGSDSELDSEANFKQGGRKRHVIMILRNARVSFGDTFFNDVERCSTDQANLDDVHLFPLSHYYDSTSLSFVFKHETIQV